MKILSFNIAHDSSVCLLKDGRVDFFCKEERLSKVKRDKHPFNSLEKLKNIKDINLAIYSVPSNNEPDIEIVYSNYIKKIFNLDLENFSSLLHHYSHAALAYFNSEFKEAIVVVIDRNGSIYFLNGTQVARESESVFVCNDNSFLTPIKKNFWMYPGLSDKKQTILNSLKNYYGDCEIQLNDYLGIVKVYEAATTLIGQNQLENGKTMGLSSYGNYDNNKKLFIKNIPRSDLFQDSDPVCFLNKDHLINSNVNINNYQVYADHAKQVQVDTQEAALLLISDAIKKTGITNVCIVGGYGLNVVANQFYIKNLPGINFYFEPISDDTGISIGAAMLKHKLLTGENPEPIKNNFFHFYEKDESVYGSISNINEVVDLLIKQKSVAIFNGNPESGPRALGNRSILFDPRNLNGKDIINKIKKREWYRPFAGVILESEFAKYFETLGLKRSEYMTINFDAKNNSIDRFPSIIHVDNTCRLQTVSSGPLFEILNLFFEITGCPLLLNTSFNLAGEPLVQTKQDAVKTFNSSELDALYFYEDSRILKKGTNEK